jgi:Tol biopolymer transport system component
MHFTMTEAREFPAGWSADSQSVIFVSNRDRAWGFYRQPLGGGPATPILTGLAPGLGFLFPRVSPDGKWLIWEVVPQVYAPGDKVDLMRVSMEGGTPQLILTKPNIIDTPRCAQLPATECVIATAPDDSHLEFTSFDPALGNARELMRVDIDREGVYTWALSPDGNRIALLNRVNAQIRVISLTASKEVKVSVGDRSNLFSLDWTADGKGLFTSSLQPGVVLHLDLQGHTDVLWEPKGQGMPWAVPSPDGRYVAMPFYARESNAWMLENF